MTLEMGHWDWQLRTRYLNYLTDTSPHHKNINMNGTKPSVNPTHTVFGNCMTRDIILARTEPSQCPPYHNSRHAYTRSWSSSPWPMVATTPRVPCNLRRRSTPGEERRLVLESLSERVAEVPEAFRSPNVSPGPVDEISKLTRRNSVFPILKSIIQAV